MQLRTITYLWNEFKLIQLVVAHACPTQLICFSFWAWAFDAALLAQLLVLAMPAMIAVLSTSYPLLCQWNVYTPFKVFVPSFCGCKPF